MDRRLEVEEKTKQSVSGDIKSRLIHDYVSTSILNQEL